MVLSNILVINKIRGTSETNKNNSPVFKKKIAINETWFANRRMSNGGITEWQLWTDILKRWKRTLLEYIAVYSALENLFSTFINCRETSASTAPASIESLVLILCYHISAGWFSLEIYLVYYLFIPTPKKVLYKATKKLVCSGYMWQETWSPSTFLFQQNNQTKTLLSSTAHTAEFKKQK